MWSRESNSPTDVHLDAWKSVGSNQSMLFTSVHKESEHQAKSYDTSWKRCKHSHMSVVHCIALHSIASSNGDFSYDSLMENVRFFAQPTMIQLIETAFCKNQTRTTKKALSSVWFTTESEVILGVVCWWSKRKYTLDFFHEYVNTHNRAHTHRHTHFFWAGEKGIAYYCRPCNTLRITNVRLTKVYDL